MQRDEEWWTKTKASGEIEFDEIEFDRSAGTFGVSVLFPIKDPNNTDTIIGVAKSVFNFSSIGPYELTCQTD